MNPKTISVDFEQAAFGAFRFHFPSTKTYLLPFHFSHAVYKKLCEIGLKTFYSNNEKFRKWVRLFMSLPFLKMDDIDETFDELKSDVADLGVESDNNKLKRFIAYLDNTWIGTGKDKDNIVITVIVRQKKLEFS